MPFNPKIKFSGKSAQDIQDEIFRKMSAGESVHLAGNFCRFARILNKLGEGYDGTRKVIKKSRRNSA